MSSGTAGWTSEITTLRAGIRLQFAVIRAHPDYWMTAIVSPLLAIVFLGIVREAGRDDLVAAATLAPVLLGLVQVSLVISGETIDDDRWAGTLEPAIAAPGSLLVSTLGRVVAVTTTASVGFVPSWVVAWGLYGVEVPVHHPDVFVAASVATVLATSATGLLMASVFVLARSARVFQNSLSWPLFVLGGVLVPVTVLPVWLQPVARLVFLSWSGDLLRDALDPAPVHHVGARLAVIVGLGLATLLLASWVLTRIVDRVRRLGSATYA
jgi:ABC-2 type transport system permease protein